MAPTSRLTAFALFVLLSVVRAVPTSYVPTRRQDDGVTPLSPADIAAFKPYTWYAGAAQCPPNTTITWDCGRNCDANPTFKPVQTGGDGDLTQFWMVGYDPTLDEVIVGHQGTDFSKFFPTLTDISFILKPLDSKLFPGVGVPILVHDGFSATHARVAPDVLSAVQTALSTFDTKKVTCVGHSLGAAIAILDAVYLPLHLPKDVTVRYQGYASPRVGNQAFADYVDAQPMSVTHINNKKDPVPILPPIALGYHHASGEIHITDADVWVHCPGQDNPSDQCSRGSANLLMNNASQHSGPFDGVEIGC